MFWSVGWPLLWAGGFFCNLDILYGGLGIGKLQFLIKKKFNFFFQLLFFFNFWSLKPWIRIGSGSVSGSVLTSIWIHWIRIRKKWIRIRNTVSQRHISRSVSKSHESATLILSLRKLAATWSVEAGETWRDSRAWASPVGAAAWRRRPSAACRWPRSAAPPAPSPSPARQSAAEHRQTN